jgi:hypothetical protein
VVNLITQRYSKQGLWSLFLMCAFPLHLWTLILVFRDMSWVAERTNAWDAIGVASYGMIFAFVESVVIFFVLALLGLITPKQWESDRRITFLAFLILITSIWAMISQLLFLWNVSLPAPAIEFLRHARHPVRIVYAVCLMVVTPTVLFPAYLFLRSKNIVTAMQGLMERLSLLAMFYLIFDLLGLIIIIVRNV